MKVTFLGAVRTVTGSMHLVETAGVRLLLDCGLFQGRRADFYRINSQFPFQPSSIDAVVLSHAHLDHCGNLPTLVSQGFRGSIYCTPATRDLTGLILRDSAKVQAQDSAFVNKHFRTGRPADRQAVESPVRPLYSAADAEATIARLVAMPYHHTFAIGGAKIAFADAGHILGSAITVVEGNGRALGFSGDLGRPGAPILRDPELTPSLDMLILESTYGDRQHDSFAHGDQLLRTAVTETAARGGKILIPSFAVGRAQDLVYALYRLQQAQAVPPIATYVDSPMAIDATDIFRMHEECFDDEIRGHLERHDPFGFKQLSYLRSADESKALNSKVEPFIVIATSGMCESGRILHHLRHHIDDPRSLLLFVGFQAEHTLGRRLADGVSPVNIFGQPHAVRMRVGKIESFSAHADRDEILAWVRRLPRVGQTYLVHGEEAQGLALAGRMTAAGFSAQLPARGQTVSV
ncbi:MAG: MBL fold metallo-hydrolase RNA specificity domain-containing protein [bacterium]